MAQDIFFTIVKYKGIPVQLEGSFTIKAGLEPDICSFTVPPDTFTRLRSTAREAGDLEFFFSGEDGAANVVYKGMKLLSWEPLEDRGSSLPITNNEPTTIANATTLQYRICLADFRERFVKPRGGRIALTGVINAKEDPLPLKNSILIRNCLKAMGVSTFVPDEVDLVPPPRDLRWFGNHAPSELEDLLDRVGAVAIPTIDAKLEIKMLGKGIDFQPPRSIGLPEVSAGKDRRSQLIIFTSAPNAIIEQFRIVGPNEDTWQFVMPDPNPDRKANRGWVSQEEAGLTSPEAELRNWFGNSRPEYRAHFDKYAYSCVRLNPALMGTGWPILRTIKSFQLDEATGKIVLADQSIQIEAKIYLQEPNFIWRNSPSHVVMQPSALYYSKGQSIIMTDRRLGKLDTNAPTGFFWKHFKALEDGDLIITFGRERKDKKTGEGKYFNVGFRLDEAGLIEQLAPEVTEAALIASDTVDATIINRPDWVLVVEDDVELNREELEKAAKAEAGRILAGSDQPAVIRSTMGYFPVDLSGRISEVSITQRPPKTSWRYNTWFLSGDAHLARLRAKELAGKSDAFPGQSQTVAERSAAGAAGATQPAVMVTPNVVPTTRPFQPSETVRLKKARETPGMYDGETVGGDSPGTVVRVFNTMEEDRSAHIAPIGLLLPGIPNGEDTDNSTNPPTVTPRFAVAWDPDAVRDIRYKTGDHQLQLAHKVNPPADADWRSIVTFTPCPAPTP